MDSVLRHKALALVTFSSSGRMVAERLLLTWPQARLFLHQSLDSGPQSFVRVFDLVAQRFHDFQGWIFVGPCGVAVRAIAPHLRSKLSDPAVVVVDVGARHVISLAGGHEGGANELANAVANDLAAIPVITTSSEAERTLIAGIGCRKGCSAQTIISLLDQALEQVQAARTELRCLATARLKAHEPGIQQAAEMLGIPLRLLSHSAIQRIAPLCAHQPGVQRRVGLPAVAEPAALLGGERTQLCLKRIAQAGATVALARENCWSWDWDPEV
ncbi:MAG TPA: cobalamin biosynthesis protein [Fibrobacteraceae bacterium]|nr:cobalamin biosynthesis protein [Fibrobacteraceae bacterium]